MRKLKLIKGLSYSMAGFSCVNGKPAMVEDEAKAEYLLSTGHFVEEPVEVEDEAKDTEVEIILSADGIHAMKLAELVELAAVKGIDISECKTNKERADKICGVLGLASTVQLGLEN